jgi:peptide/nickel transport system permease protein
MGTGSRPSGTSGEWLIRFFVRGAAFIRFLVRRSILAILVLLGVVIIVFFLARVIPADPAGLWAGPHATRADIEKARAILHLNDLLPVQFWYYLTGILHGDLGVSIGSQRPVLVDVETTLPATLELIVASSLLAIVIGIPLGVYASVKRGRWPDHLTRGLAIGGVSLPTFWFAVMLQLVFVQVLRILPFQGRFDNALALQYPIRSITGFLVLDSLLEANPVRMVDAIVHLILPAITLALYPIGLVARMVRTMMVEVLGENYIRTAKAYGLPPRLIYFRLALKNAIAPAIVALGLAFAYELTGAFLVEAIFGWNGIGQYAYTAAISFDYPAIVGVAIVVAAFYVVANLVVDIIQSFLDPRVILTRKEA